ncbi:hypothetical protein FB451DRAFT_1169141 [Mycena latifolia]|nr:hypothetical protein FB451DRAFT_1169141 [Mycena latifolia]
MSIAPDRALSPSPLIPSSMPTSSLFFEHRRGTTLAFARAPGTVRITFDRCYCLKRVGIPTHVVALLVLRPPPVDHRLLGEMIISGAFSCAHNLNTSKPCAMELFSRSRVSAIHEQSPAELPIISSGSDLASEDEDIIVEQIRRAFKSYGIPEEVLQQNLATSAEFFSLNDEAKMRQPAIEALQIVAPNIGWTFIPLMSGTLIVNLAKALSLQSSLEYEGMMAGERFEWSVAALQNKNLFPRGLTM